MHVASFASGATIYLIGFDYGRGVERRLTGAEAEGIIDQVHTIGTVKTLAPHYRSARLVAMPVTAGAGIAIKALEALGAGRPIVSSLLAYRGLPPGFQPPEPKPTSDASELAAIISGCSTTGKPMTARSGQRSGPT